MGIRAALQALFGRDQVMHIEWLGPGLRDMVLGLTEEELFRTQPYLRQVLTFVARNVAHPGLKAYERTADADRRRLHDDPLALLIRRPNRHMTQFELLEGLALDLGLYDHAYWWVHESTEMPSGWEIQPLPPSWAQSDKGGSAFMTGDVTFAIPGKGTQFVIPAKELLVFHGWNPDRPKHGLSPLESLRQVLAEQVQAWSYREQVWQRGGRVGAFLTRPVGVQWSAEARSKFIEQWREKWTGPDGARAGGTPILEDGMELKRLGFSAREDEWVEVSKLALSTVAGAYHVNPVMVGILDNANFSNTKEFRKMLYSETLGPTFARIEDRLNAFLVPRVSRNADAYVEFNIEEKLQGDFEEQAAILSTSAGAPWMTRNEVRALRNLPAIDGGDELVVPLNVVIGGQASPRDSGTQNESSRPVELVQVRSAIEAPMVSVKSPDAVRVEHVLQAAQVLERFFVRQRGTVLAALGAKDPAWWDGARWDAELADDLYKLAVATAGEIGRAQAEALGFSADDYDEDRTLAFLRAVAESRAAAVNAATLKALEDPVDDPAAVFDRAIAQRSGAGAGALVAALAGFAVVEVGKQLVGPRATKSWLVTSGNPRASHAAMSGQTVGVGEKFSNGADWPGDPVLGADGVAGCMCGVEINYRRGGA